MSLTDQFQLTRRRKWSLTDLLGLNYQAGNWELFLNGSVNRSNSFIKGTTTNTLVYDGQKTVVGSRQNNIYPITAGTEKVKREEKAYRPIPVITDFRDGDGRDCMKEMIQENYNRIKAEVKQIVADELERIQNDPALVHLLQQK